MQFLIDRTFNLTFSANLYRPRYFLLRQALMFAGLSYPDANAFTLFARYGLLLPSGEPTLTLAQLSRLYLAPDFLSSYLPITTS